MSASAVHPIPEAGIKEISRNKPDEERRFVLIKPRSADGGAPWLAGKSMGRCDKARATPYASGESIVARECAVST